MARRIVERVLDVKKPLVARRRFSAAGRIYEQGDLFDWRRLSFAQRRVAQMFEAGTLRHLDDDEDLPEAAAPDNLEPTKEPQSSDEPTQEPEKSDEPAQETVVAAEATTTRDDSDLNVDRLSVLQEIATREGAPIKPTKAAQIEAIVAHRNAG